MIFAGHQRSSQRLPRPSSHLLQGRSTSARNDKPRRISRHPIPPSGHWMAASRLSTNPANLQIHSTTATDLRLHPTTAHNYGESFEITEDYSLITAFFYLKNCTEIAIKIQFKLLSAVIRDNHAIKTLMWALNFEFKITKLLIYN